MLSNGFSAEDWEILKIALYEPNNGSLEYLELAYTVKDEPDDNPFKQIAQRLLDCGFADEINIYFWW